MNELLIFTFIDLILICQKKKSYLNNTQKAYKCLNKCHEKKLISNDSNSVWKFISYKTQTDNNYNCYWFAIRLWETNIKTDKLFNNKLWHLINFHSDDKQQKKYKNDCRIHEQLQFEVHINLTIMQSNQLRRFALVAIVILQVCYQNTRQHAIKTNKFFGVRNPKIRMGESLLHLQVYTFIMKDRTLLNHRNSQNPCLHGKRCTEPYRTTENGTVIAQRTRLATTQSAIAKVHALLRQ